MTQPILATVDPVTHALPIQTESRYVSAAQVGAASGVAALDAAGKVIDATGTPVPDAAALTAVANGAVAKVAGTKDRHDFHIVGTSWPPRPATTDSLRFVPWPVGHPELAVPNLQPTTTGSLAGGGGMVIGTDTCILAQFSTAP